MTRKIIMLVGLMGSGKTSVGRKLSKLLGLPFVDSDAEIEKASHLKLIDLFRAYGEEAFLQGEERVMERLLSGPPCVLSSGGSAYTSAKTRALARKAAIVIWLRADLDVLCVRTAGRSHRPQVPGENPKGTLETLSQQYTDAYKEADIIVKTLNENVEETAKRVFETLKKKKLI